MLTIGSRQTSGPVQEPGLIARHPFFPLPVHPTSTSYDTHTHTESDVLKHKHVHLREGVKGPDYTLGVSDLSKMNQESCLGARRLLERPSLPRRSEKVLRNAALNGSALEAHQVLERSIINPVKCTLLRGATDPLRVPVSAPL